MTHALIIDDERMNIDVLTMMLARENITYSAISSPRNLSQTLDGGPSIDVVFLDLEMPNYDGFALLGELKSHPRLQGVPVVAYTVHTNVIDSVRRAGFDGFVGKPLNNKRFPDQVRRILEGEQVWEIGGF